MSGAIPVRVLSRRDFLRHGLAGGAGFVLSCYAAPGAGGPAALRAAPAAFAPNAFLRIDPDGAVTIWVPKAEMGQGVRTSLPMLVAEELEADWAKVRVEQAVFDRKYGAQNTGGSNSVRSLWTPLRTAGAAAREMLVTAAALRWGAGRDECHAENGAVVHRASGRRLPYGALAEAASALPVPAAPPLKDPSRFRLIGKRIARTDGDAIVRGTACYGLDVRVPGMLVASVERCPVFGGKLARHDGARALAMPGVRAVVPIEGRGICAGVAVVADSTWRALRGRQALAVEWDEGAHGALGSDAIRAGFRAGLEGPAKSIREVGASSGRGEARRLEAFYEVPFLAHAPLEPMNCVAHVRADGCDVWAPVQFPEWAHGAAVQITGLPPESVRVHTTLLGGAFGRRINVDYVVEAVLISKAVEAPVQVVWSREDDMRHGRFRPASLHRMRAGLDSGGTPLSWAHRIAGTTIMGQDPRFPHPEAQDVWGARDLPYSFPSLRVEHVTVQYPVPPGWLRGVERTQNVFAAEAFMDEVAHAAGADPLDFRLRMLEPGGTLRFRDYFPPDNPDEHALDRGRLRAVLEVVRDRSGWGAALPAGRGRGVACCAYMHAHTYVAQVAEVSAGPGGAVRVHRVVTAIDCGTVVNPDMVEAQVEGAVAFALSSVLGGEITIANGRVQQSTYGDYPIVRMREMPVVEVHIVPSAAPPGGVGEPPVPAVAPAVVNAIFAATGVRVRRLPLRAGDLRAAD